MVYRIPVNSYRAQRAEVLGYIHDAKRRPGGDVRSLQEYLRIIRYNYYTGRVIR